MKKVVALQKKQRVASPFHPRDKIRQALAWTDPFIKLLLEQIPAVLWSTDSDLRITSTMGSVLQNLGQKPNQIVGKTLYEYLSTKDPTFTPIQAHLDVLRGKSISYDYSWKDSYYEAHVEPLKNEEGEIIGCVGIALDISIRKKAEKALKEAQLQLENRVAERTAELSQTNEALKEEIAQRIKAEQAQEKAQKRVKRVFQYAAIGVAIFENNGRFLEVNRFMAEWLGYKEEELIKMNLRDLLHEEDRNTFWGLLKLMFSGEIRSQQFETRYLDKDHNIVWGLSSLALVKDEAGKGIYFALQIQDIVIRKQIENALRKSESQNRALIEAIPDLLFRINANGLLLDIKSPRDFPISFDFEKAKGLSILDVFPEEMAIPAIKYGEKAERESESQVFEFQLMIDQLVRHFEARIVAIGKDEKLGIVRDITEGRLVERRILEATHREQQRIGQDLHDGVGQLLTGISFLGKVLEQKLMTKNPDESRDINHIVELVSQAIGQTRLLAQGLCPVDLEREDFGIAIKALAKTFKNTFQVSCVVSVNRPLSIDKDTQTQLYRIIQEALHNAVRHGKATRIQIRLNGTLESLSLSIKDNGQGFSKSRLKKRGMGLHIMHHRARLLGAHLEIESGDSGTALHLFKGVSKIKRSSRGKKHHHA